MTSTPDRRGIDALIETSMSAGARQYAACAGPARTHPAALDGAEGHGAKELGAKELGARGHGGQRAWGQRAWGFRRLPPLGSRVRSAGWSSTSASSSISVIARLSVERVTTVRKPSSPPSPGTCGPGREMPHRPAGTPCRPQFRTGAARFLCMQEHAPPIARHCMPGNVPDPSDRATAIPQLWDCVLAPPFAHASICCRAVGVDPQTVQREHPPGNPDIRSDLNRVAEKRLRFGYPLPGKDLLASRERRAHRCHAGTQGHDDERKEALPQ